MNEDYLMHYGVLGMKWGIRKDRGSSGKSSGESGSSGKKKDKNQESRVQKAKKSVKEKLANIDKEKVKDVAKSTAVVAGKVAVAATLGSIGVVAFNEAQRAIAANSVRSGAVTRGITEAIVGSKNMKAPSYDQIPRQSASNHNANTVAKEFAEGFGRLHDTLPTAYGKNPKTGKYVGFGGNSDGYRETLDDEYWRLVANNSRKHFH